ncbi:MAG: hypothetical protein BJG00_010330 [Limnothrix sp. CACIAM 69d]|nr:MAG: hypothetical protein BJG00_010330 [Limnothrix sp. CACIAM 69d]
MGWRCEIQELAAGAEGQLDRDRGFREFLGSRNLSIAIAPGINASLSQGSLKTLGITGDQPAQIGCVLTLISASLPLNSALLVILIEHRSDILGSLPNFGNFWGAITKISAIWG